MAAVRFEQRIGSAGEDIMTLPADGEWELQPELIAAVLPSFSGLPTTLLENVRQGKRLLTRTRRTGIARKAFIELGGAHYVLKEFPFYARNEQFACGALDFQRRLRELELPIPAYVPLLADANKYYYIEARESGPSIYTLQHMAHGACAGAKAAESSFAVTLLVELEAASRAISNQIGALTQLPHDNVFDCTLRLLGQGPEEMRGRHSLLWPTLEADVAALVREYTNHVEGYRRLAAAAGYFKQSQPVHGDCHVNNMLFAPAGQVAALLDFDDCKQDNPIHDVARFAVSLCVFDFTVDPDAPFVKVPTAIDLERMGQLLCQYLEAARADFAFDVVACFTMASKCAALQMGLIGLLSGGYGRQQLAHLSGLPAVLDEFLHPHWFASMGKGAIEVSNTSRPEIPGNVDVTSRNVHDRNRAPERGAASAQCPARTAE